MQNSEKKGVKTITYLPIKEKIEALITYLPEQKLVDVLGFIETLTGRTQELSDNEILKAAEQAGSFKFLEDDIEDIYSLKDGEPIQ